jgi:preprotein translocase subunit SecD
MPLRYAFRIAMSLTLGLVIASCGRQQEEPHRVISVAGPPPDVSFRAASLEAVPGWNQMGGPNAPIWVAPEAAVTLSDVERAEQSKDELGHPAIGLSFTAGGAQKMRSLSAAQLGKLIAIVVDGKVVSAPRVNSQVTDRAVISGGSGGFDQHEIDRILAFVKRK